MFHYGNPQFLAATLAPPTASSHAWYFCFTGNKLLLPDGSVSQLVPLAAAPATEGIEARHYLGRLAEYDCWVVRLAIEPVGWQPISLRAAMMQMPAGLLTLVARAAQINEWDRAHRFCGVCGTPTELKATERARQCPACQHEVYPRISPAMMALVWRDQEILLARSPGFASGVFSALAGFVEAGESVEECVVREVQEEVGVIAGNLQYYGSQNWPFPHSLMLAFTAEWQGGEIVPQAGEIEEAAWFSIDALPGIPPRFSISGHLIRDTVEKIRNGQMRHQTGSLGE